MFNVTANLSASGINYSNEITASFPKSGNPSSYLAGGIYMTIMPTITAPASGLLLFALFRDPLKCFQSSSVILVKSMTIANFAIGLLVEPLYAFIYISIFLGRYNVSYVRLLAKTALVLSCTTNNTSFITVGTLALDHLAAVSKPQWYKTKLTKRNLTACTVAIWLYSTGFGLVSLSSIPDSLHHKIDLHVNTTTSLVLLLASYVALAICYQVHRKRNTASNVRAAKDKKVFVVIALLVVIASIAGFPTAIALHVYFYCERCHSSAFYVSFEVIQNMFFLKFATDPFLYAWRLRRYRKSLRIAVKQSGALFSFGTSRKHRYEFKQAT